MKEKQEKFEKLAREMKDIQEKLEKENVLMINFEKEYQVTPEKSYPNRRFLRIHFAAKKNYKEVVEILLSKGDYINAKDIIYQIMI